MYKINTYVVYPMYGICKVIGISDNKVNSNLVECYVLECEGENITLKVPINRVKEYRIRKIISKSEAENLLNVLQTKIHDIENNWKIRYQENEENDTLENNTDNYGHEDFTETDESEEYIEDKEDGDDDDDDTLYYNQEELEEMTDDELKEVLQSMEIEYDDESFTREAAIIAILENYDNND